MPSGVRFFHDSGLDLKFKKIIFLEIRKFDTNLVQI